MRIEDKVKIYKEHAIKQAKALMYDPQQEEEYFRWCRTIQTLKLREKELKEGKWK